MLLYLDIVETDVPLLFGLNLLRKNRSLLFFEKRLIGSRADGWTAPLIRKNGHDYIQWKPSILYTEKDLQKIQRHLHHPSPTKTYSLLKRTDPAKVPPNILAGLENINATCDVWQKEPDAPYCFHVSLLEEGLVPNHTACRDLMSISRKTVLMW